MKTETPKSNIQSQIQILDKEVVALSMTRDAFQYQRMLYKLTNLLEQRTLAIKQKQIAGDRYRKEYEDYIEKVNEDIMKLLAI